MSSSNRRGRVVDFAVRFRDEWRDDRVPDQAAVVAFYSFLSLFPALLALAAVMGGLDNIIGQEDAQRVEDQVLNALRGVLSDEAGGTLEAIERLFAQSSPGLLTVSLVVAVWTVTRGFAALVRALDVAYDIDEHRPWIKIRLTSLALAVGTVVALAVMLTLLVVGPLLGTGSDIADTVGMGDAFVFVWDVLRLPVAFTLLVLWSATVFHIAPDHHTPWKADLPGAVVTTTLWLVFSGGLRVYVEVAQSGSTSIGALGGVLIVLLWMWLLSLAILIGGEINQLLIDGREASAGVESSAQVSDELPGFHGGTPVEKDAHDG